MRSKCKEDSQEYEYDWSFFTRITDFPYVPNAMRNYSMLIVIMHHSKSLFQF